MEPHDASGKTYGQRFEHAGVVAEAVRPAGPVGGTLAATWGWELILAGLLYFLAGVAGLFGVLGGLYVLSEAAIRGIRGPDWLAVGLWIVGGLSVAGLLAAGGLLLSLVGRQGRQLRDAQGRVAALAGQIEHLPRGPQQSDRGELLAQVSRLGERVDKLTEAVNEVAVDCLLDEAGRAGKIQQVSARQRDATAELIRAEMASGRWDLARGALARFRGNYPAATEQAARLAEELDRRRQQAEAEDVAAARRQCEELMSVSAWDRAAAVAFELVQRHPESTLAKALLARVDRERKVLAEQQRQALYAQVQRHTSRREWADAVQAAQRLIAQFPESIEAEALKTQMETLVANSEIQRRQAMEASIKDLVKRQRIEEAVALAEELIAKYPNSPQASALRGTLDGLRVRAEMAAHEARKRRVQWQ